MTLDELKKFAQWLIWEADYQVNESCNCHAEYFPSNDLVLKETERWWRENHLDT